MLRVLVTGAAGFIGSHLAAALADKGHTVVGCDRGGGEGLLGRLRRDRVEHQLKKRGIAYEVTDLADPEQVRVLFERNRFQRVVHLAARAGVRQSIDEPASFIQANLVAFGHVLEACRRHGVEYLVYASSSSVYGAREKVPFSEADRADSPSSLYAATKRANELMAHSYAHVHGLRSTGLRFFTVYGPWGRPDMAYFDFAQRIRRGEPITVYGDGTLRRDFTYIDDVVEAIRRVAEGAPPSGSDGPPHEILNVGHHVPVEVRQFVALLERAVGRSAVVRHAPVPRADVPVTCADPTRLRERTGLMPTTDLAEGLVRFARWLEAWDPVPGAGPS